MRIGCCSNILSFSRLPACLSLYFLSVRTSPAFSKKLTQGISGKVIAVCVKVRDPGLCPVSGPAGLCRPCLLLSSGAARSGTLQENAVGAARAADSPSCGEQTYQVGFKGNPGIGYICLIFDLDVVDVQEDNICLPAAAAPAASGIGENTVFVRKAAEFGAGVSGC